MHEVEEHYKISKKLARTGLREAIKSGDVLVSKRPIFQTPRTSKEKLEWQSEAVYVFRGSSMIEDGLKLGAKKPNNRTSKAKYDFPFIRPAKVHSSIEKKACDKPSKLSSTEGTERSRDLHTDLNTVHALTSKLHLPLNKVKMVKRMRIERLVVSGTRMTRDVKSLSSVEKIHLLRTLMKPATFLDVHGRFGVSKEMVKRLVKNGLIAEVWGPKAVGLRFKLTRNGRAYLRELEKAARCEPRIEEKAFVKLKKMTMF
jgi:hypothetical protein